MRLAGRLHLLWWRLRLQARKSSLLRELVRRIRGMMPDTRERHLKGEVEFWRKWMATEGLSWPEDYRRRMDPSLPIEPYLAAVIDRLPGESIDLLDVGAGPLTAVGKLHSTKSVRITATDVLAPEYNELLDEFGIVPIVRTQFAEAEKLRSSLGERQFDIVHAVNSLDHSADPVAGIEEMLAMVRAGGFIVLLHEENEGMNELYFALHKWDFSSRAGHFLISGPGPRGGTRDVTELLSGRGDVDCSVDDGNILVVIQKL
jgi:SAM-dependent methyltransferase